MRYYTQQHRFYCGVDLHARTMYLCILDGAGQIVYDKTLAARRWRRPWRLRGSGTSARASSRERGAIKGTSYEGGRGCLLYLTVQRYAELTKGS